VNIHLSSPERWEQLNAKVGKYLGTPENCTVRVYPSTALAVYEAASGLLQFFPHKRVLAQMKGASPHFGFLMPWLYKEGLEMQTFLPGQEESPWLESLRLETNFVLSAVDHPITGEVFDSNLRKSFLSDKKIFSIEVSHQVWLREAKAKSWKINPFEVRILEVAENLCLLVAGSRFKCFSLVAPQMPLSEDGVMEKLVREVENFTEDSEKIQDFAKSLPESWRTEELRSRVAQQIFIFNKSINSEWVRHLVLQKHPELANDIFSTSLCDLHERNQFFEWWLPQPAPEVLRGGLVLGLKFLEKKLDLSSFTSLS
jgi:hypothetical protein